MPVDVLTLTISPSWGSDISEFGPTHRNKKSLGELAKLGQVCLPEFVLFEIPLVFVRRHGAG